MKNSRKERKQAKLAAKANEQLILCRQAAAFHKAYLEILYGIEETYYEAIQARLAALKLEPETTVTTTETVEEAETAGTLEW